MAQQVTYTQLKIKTAYREKLANLAYTHNRSMANMVEVLIDAECLQSEVQVRPNHSISFALTLEARIDELKQMLSHAREHTITDIEMVMHHSGNTIDFIEGVDTRHFETRLAALEPGNGGKVDLPKMKKLAKKLRDYDEEPEAKK